MIKNLFFYFFVCCLLINSLNAYGQSELLYGRSFWRSVKVTYSQRIVDVVEKSRPESSRLLSYYYKKYNLHQRENYKRAVKELMPHYDNVQTADALAEALAYRHIVFHETRWHKMDNNIETAGKYSSLITSLAARYDLPPAIALAVISWENSGDTDKMSYAMCGGLGQLSQGAVNRAHQYAMNLSRRKKLQAKTSSPEKAALLREEANFYNLDAKHKMLCKKYGVKDERMIAECNAEDTVIYLKILMDYFDNRSDLAISAYHNGVKNNDDLIKALLPSQSAKMGLVDLIREHDVNYLSLWNNVRTRDMLNGWLTMDGELTDNVNYQEALGDESDIYPWKIIGAYAAFIGTKNNLLSDIESARGKIGEFECSGLELYSNSGQIKKALKSRKLLVVEIREGNVFKECFVTPELAGFLLTLRDDISRVKPGKKFNLPLRDMLDESCEDGDISSKTRFQGVSCNFDLSKFIFSKELKKRLDYYYLHDKIYLSRDGDFYNVCLNPRYGLEFFEASKHLK